MPLPHYDVYREQLSSLLQGHALWEPNPGNVYSQVSVGDVGYVKEGYFTRLFNVLIDWDHPSNRTVVQPDPYPRLELGDFCNIREQDGQNFQAESPDDILPTRYMCRRQGALLRLPYDGIRKDVIRTKVFEDYIRENVDNWFSLAQRFRLDVERMEDLILVSGCTLVTAWGVAAFPDSTLDAEVSLRVNHAGTIFDWHQIRPSVVYQNSHQDPRHARQNQCIFIRGFRAKRVLIWTRIRGAAGPHSLDPDNTREDEIQVTRVPNVPSYRDPLIGVLDYIAEKSPENTLAIAHDDDLHLVEEVDVLTADAVEDFLRQNEINVLVENGAAILHEEDEPQVPEEVKAIFYAEAELKGELVPLILHPVLWKYLLKIDISKQAVDHDYDLPHEDMASSAVHPPMASLKLENHQGYPQLITVEASSESPSGVTVQDVLRTIHEDFRIVSRRREWIKLNVDERAGVDIAFRGRCRTEDELGQGPCRIDFLHGRNRLQILPKLSPDGEMLPAPVIPVELLRESA
ncbi:hypothetical protein F5148DRAFT_1289653 [Russula earlei]|uniref:Uncharacterized protein n=1 Tax=Russula earlei TaxID=71964 RepID=A0ACC0TX76_9AGAM|nr:hypothetical protein F5148DRAFT_1289653 [Russula earlei]